MQNLLLDAATFILFIIRKKKKLKEITVNMLYIEKGISHF